MANFDKVILNGTTYAIPSGGGTVDTQLSPVSTNAVQNKVIYDATNLYTYHSTEYNFTCSFALEQTENNEEYRIDIDLSNTILGGTYLYVYIPLNGSSSYQDSSADYMFLRFAWSDLSDVGYWDRTNDDIYASHTDITLSQSNRHIFVNIKPTAFDGHSNYLYGTGYLYTDNERYTKTQDFSYLSFTCLNTTVYYKYNTPLVQPLTYYVDELKKTTVNEVTGANIDSNYWLNIAYSEKNLLTKKIKSNSQVPGFQIDSDYFDFKNNKLKTKYIFKSLSSQPSDTITQPNVGVQLTNDFTTSTTAIKIYFKPESHGQLTFEIRDDGNGYYMNVQCNHYETYNDTYISINGYGHSFFTNTPSDTLTYYIDEITDTVTFTNPYFANVYGDIIDYNYLDKIEFYNNCTIESIQDKVNRLEADKQDVIDSSHKLDADLVDDTTSTNKFVTASDKSTWSGKQDELVSGTNIKTINNESILGSGNITIQGGGASYTAGDGIDITNDVISVDIDDEKKVIASALTELHNDKADKQQLNNYQLKGDYVEQSAVDASIAAAVANYRTEAEALNVEKVDAAALTDLNARVSDLEQGGGGSGITGITMNGSAVTVTSGVANLGTVITEHQSLANYYTKSEIDAMIGNISSSLDTINGEVI